MFFKVVKPARSQELPLCSYDVAANTNIKHCMCVYVSRHLKNLSRPSSCSVSFTIILEDANYGTASLLKINFHSEGRFYSNLPLTHSQLSVIKLILSLCVNEILLTYAGHTHLAEPIQENLVS